MSSNLQHNDLAKFWKQIRQNLIQIRPNLDEILSVPNLTGVYIGPADMSSSYGLPPKFDVKDDPVYSNIKLIAKKAKEYGKIAGIHNGSVDYAKEMIEIGYRFVTILSDFRVMSSSRWDEKQFY